jgi:hypothetical protein
MTGFAEGIRRVKQEDEQNPPWRVKEFLKSFNPLCKYDLAEIWRI